MFNFIFDGKIGDILAPVVPQNKMFLAIQHFKNAELNELLNTTGYNPNSEVNGVYGPLHVACRYNNRFAVEILLSRGANIQLVDQNGDSPLHFAAKGGHVDLCKFLVERGALTYARNKQNQSPYDVAESHQVRQYLLPLQLAAEGAMAQFQQQPPPTYGNIGGSSYAAPSNYGAPQVPMTMSAPPAYQQQAMTSAPLPVAPMAVSASNPPTSISPPCVPPPAGSAPIPPMVTGPPVGGFAMGQVPSYGQPIAVNRPANARVIQADGFHSSASDPVLQQKYGHIIERPNIAPPPMAGQVPFQAASTPSGINTIPLQPAPSAGIYSRYVAYDAHQNAAAPPPLVAYNAPVTYTNAPTPTTFIPVAASSSSSMNVYPASTYAAPPSVVPMSQPVVQPMASLAPPQSSAQLSDAMSSSSAATASPAAGTTSRLLGNKAPLATEDDFFRDIAINRSPSGSGPPNVFQ